MNKKQWNKRLEHNTRQSMKRRQERQEANLAWIERRKKVICQQKRAVSLYARYRIERLFKLGATLYFSDIADILDMDIRVVVKICKKLMKAGKIYSPRKRKA